MEAGALDCYKGQPKLLGEAVGLGGKQNYSVTKINYYISFIIKVLLNIDTLTMVLSIIINIQFS